MNYTLINAAKRFKGCITTPASSLVMGYDPTQLLFNAIICKFADAITGARGTDLPLPFFLTFCLQIYFQ
jgi:hypothetical protein